MHDWKSVIICENKYLCLKKSINNLTSNNNSIKYRSGVCTVKIIKKCIASKYN